MPVKIEKVREKLEIDAELRTFDQGSIKGSIKWRYNAFLKVN